MKYLVLVGAMLLLNACASVHPGGMSVPVSGENNQALVVSGQQLNDSDKEPFQMIGFTFENVSDQWVRIEKVEMLISEADAPKNSVVVGQDLVDWATATKARFSVDQHNKAIAMGAIAGVGGAAAAMGSSRGDYNTALAGASLYAAAAIWAVSDALAMDIKNAQSPKAVPSDYIMNTFSVPGRGFLRRWILLNVPRSEPYANAAIRITYVDGRSEVRKVAVK